eukprot:1304316-Pyramimonas_sp.AAC.1
MPKSARAGSAVSSHLERLVGIMYLTHVGQLQSSYLQKRLQNHQTRFFLESRALNSVCCPS